MGCWERSYCKQRRRSIRFARAGHQRGSRQSHRRRSPSADNSRIHAFKGCFWNETRWPQARARHEGPRTSLRCHLHIALPCLHLILRKQPAFANNVAFGTRCSSAMPSASTGILRTRQRCKAPKKSAWRSFAGYGMKSGITSKPSLLNPLQPAPDERRPIRTV